MPCLSSTIFMPAMSAMIRPPSIAEPRMLKYSPRVLVMYFSPVLLALSVMRKDRISRFWLQ